MKKTASLKKNTDFKSVYNKGRSLADKYLVMYILKNGTQNNRLGISVSKKIGNSVIRHHITRLVRESYRVNEDGFYTGYDIVFIGRINANTADFHDIEKSVLKLSDRHGIRIKPD